MVLVSMVKIQASTGGAAFDLIVQAVATGTADTQHKIVVLLSQVNIVKWAAFLLYPPIYDDEPEDTVGLCANPSAMASSTCLQRDVTSFASLNC